jgi:hypothetical protein
MDIFKLFFDHDLRLDRLAKRNANKTPDEVEASLEEFMKPVPTYSKFYLTGTQLDREKFGINVLEKYPQIIERLDLIFKNYTFLQAESTSESLNQALDRAETGDAILITRLARPEVNVSDLKVDEESNVGHFKEELSEILLQGHLVLYKEQAHDGFDLHLFSKENIYEQLFYAFKELLDDSFRFFSINNKRIRTERHFYFETWTLDRPPHGAEEVRSETTL